MRGREAYGVAVDVLGNAMHDDIGAKVKRVLHVGAQEGIVDDDEDAMAVGDGSDSADINKAERRVTRAFNPDKLSLIRADKLRNIGLDTRRKGNLHTMCLGDLSKVAMSPAIDIRNANDMAARRKGLEDGSRRRGARGKSQGVLGVLERRDGRLEVIPVRIRGPHVFVPSDGLAHARLCERGAQRDRLDDGAGDGVVWAPGVHGESAELVDWGGGAGRGGDAGLDGEGGGRHCWVLAGEVEGLERMEV